MKKLLLSLSCTMILGLASCGGDTSVAGTFNSVANKLEKAQTPEQVMKAVTDGNAEFEKLAEKYPDFEPTEADIKAQQRMQQALMDACERAGLDIDDILL